MHIITIWACARALWERRIVKFLWVVIVAVSCFVLGYTLQPRPSRETMLRGGRPPAFNQMPPGAMPPGGRR